MRSNTSTWQWTSLALLALGVVGYAGQGLMAAASTKPASKKGGFPYVGVVTGNDVYVRSRDDQNWYPTTKLNKGDRVEVHEEKLGWLKIRPPRGSFCYVDKAFVARDRGNKGVIKGDNVYIRAGSQLPKFERNKRAVVTQLDKGAEVTIIDEHKDGYYKIVPPDSAYYWIYGDYVKKLDTAAAEAEPAKLPDIDPIKKEDDKATAKPETDIPAEADSPKKPPADALVQPEATSARERLLGPDTAKAPTAKKPPADEPEAPPAEQPKPKPLLNIWQKKLDMLNAEWRAALRKRPREAEDFRSLRERFLPIAQQKQEDIPRQYAQIRLEQIDQVLDDLARLKEVRSILSSLDERKQRRAEASTKPAVKAAPPRPDYQGVLERSFAFEGRYRVVRPADKKTLVYVEFAADASMDPQQYVGRYVNVWVKTKRYDESVRRNVVVPAKIALASPPKAPAGTGPASPGPPAPVSGEPTKANQPASVDTLE